MTEEHLKPSVCSNIIITQVHLTKPVQNKRHQKQSNMKYLIKKKHFYDNLAFQNSVLLKMSLHHDSICK